MMPPETTYYDILEECIAAVLSEQATIQQCLDAYPNYASELEPELTVAILTNRLKSPVMSEQAVDRLEARLMQQFSTAPTLQSANRSRTKVVQFPFMQPISRAAAVVVIVLMLAVGSGGAVIAASADDLPGEPLYGVKRFWESVILFFASIIGQSDDVWLHLAQTRFHELSLLYSRGDVNTEVYDDLHDAVLTAIEHADTTSTPDLVDFMESSYQIITTQMQPTALFVQAQARVLRILMPHYDTNGRLSLPPEDDTDAASRPVAEVTATYTPSYTPTEMVTESPTPTATNTASPTVTPTSTSRIPPTPTRTPTLTPSPTITSSPVPTATYTWTPLPLPGGSQTGGNNNGQSTPETYEVGEGTPFPTQNTNPDYWIRQTQQSVYMTQTAIAVTNGTEEPAPPGE